jgi:hypothetical protein
MLSAFHNRHHPDLAQHAEMLGYRRLRNLHSRNDVVDCPFLPVVEKADDLSSPGSAIALKTSVVVAALAMQLVYDHIGMYVKSLRIPGNVSGGLPWAQPTLSGVASAMHGIGAC